MIVEDEQRGHWPLTRAVRPLPGADGRAYAAEVKKAAGVFIRPTGRLYLLEESYRYDSTPSTV